MQQSPFPKQSPEPHHHRDTTALIFGIVSLLFFRFPILPVGMGIAAVIFARKSKTDSRTNHASPSAVPLPARWHLPRQHQHHLLGILSGFPFDSAVSPHRDGSPRAGIPRLPRIQRTAGLPALLATANLLKAYADADAHRF